MSIRHPHIPPVVYRKILIWVQGNFFQQHKGLKFMQDEAFLYIDGVDYYVLGQQADGEVEYKVTVLKTLNDLPLLLPSEVPGEVYARLEKHEKKGWVRQVFPEGGTLKYWSDEGEQKTRRR